MEPYLTMDEFSLERVLRKCAMKKMINCFLMCAQDTINAETVELLEPYLTMDDYSLENAKKVCGDVAGLCGWTIAMSFFYGINREVLPLKVSQTLKTISALFCCTSLSVSCKIFRYSVIVLFSVPALAKSLCITFDKLFCCFGVCADSR